METCIRGFSFMPEDKVEEKSLQYVEELELERTWKSSRRERLKQQEKRIWDEFVKEQDIVTSVCRDDPYQFVNEIPKDRLEEFLESELKKMRKASPDYDDETNDVNHLGSSELAQLDTENQRTVMFASEDQDECDMFHIFDDEDVSGPEAEVLNESVSPVTVREKADDTGRELSPMSAPHAPDSEKSVKSSENVVGMIENSIYCAKVNDLRIKINDELLAIIMSLECQNVMAMDPEDLQKTRKRSTEFCMRFNRIRMYQLQRQLHDVNRHNVALPFAKHTHFQSQMVRITSLHQNLLQALQVFHKSLERGAWLRESVVTLRALLMALRDAGAVARAAQPPPTLSAARGLCDDDIEASADKLEKAIDEYATKISSLLKSSENLSPALSKKGVGKKKGRLCKSVNKVDGVEGRLSMYSLDTLRINLPKSCSSKGYQSSGTSKKRGKVMASSGKSSPQPKSHRKSPKSRRPLMRAPQGAARRRAPRDADIHTMVEAVAVDTCTSSHISREQSPQMSSHFGTPRRRSRDQTPRTPRTPHSAHTPHNRESPKATPRNLCLRTQSPKAKHRRSSPKISPKQRSIKIALSSIASETNELHEQISPIQISPTPVAPLVKGKISKKDVEKKEVKKIGKKDEKKMEKKENPPNLKEEYVQQQKEATKEAIKALESPKKTPRSQEEAAQSRAGREQERYEKDSNSTPPRSDRKNERDKSKSSSDRRVDGSPRCQVSTLLRMLCGGDASGGRNERVSGAKNAQLHCVSGGSPRQPSTPQLLRILEETIQKKAPRPHHYPSPTEKEIDRLRLTFHIPQKTTDSLFQYRTKFVQHMLSSSMYANSAVMKPWEMIGSVSEQLIDEILLGCMKEMELQEVIQELYKSETR